MIHATYKRVLAFTGWFLLSTGCLLKAQTSTGSTGIKIFSKYNYYTSEKEVTVLAELPQQPGNYSLHLFNNNVPAGSSHTINNNLLSIHLPVTSFPSGSTRLHYTLLDNDRLVQEGNIDIVKLQPKPNEVKIDLQTGGLIADGLPFFPFGFYCRPVANLPEQEITHGFNLIAPYQSNLQAGFEERKAYLDRCARLGMKVQYSVNSLVGSGHNGARGLDMTEEQKEEILKQEVIAFRDHPALLSWYINDEPDGQGRPTELIEKAYKIVHELDPYHPVSIVFMMPTKFHLFRNAMDIAMTDPYPVPGPLNQVEEYVKQLDKDFRHEKSIWLVPQAFGGQEMWNREPTAREIRLMTYLGLIHGAKGIQYYTHAAGNLNPQAVSAWSVCSDMAVEINQMSPFLLSGEGSVPVSVSDSNMLVKSFLYKNDLLIIAANRENKPSSFSLQVNKMEGKWASSSSVLLWFENRQTSFQYGKINDMIDALGTRVYLVKGNMSADSSAIYAGNLTINPSFEKIVSPGLPIGSNTKKSFPDKPDAGASFFSDPRQSVDGMFSLRLTTPVDSTGDKIRLLPIVLKAKNSYNISIWAKAKASDRMPVLRLSIDALRQEKTFMLSNNWQRYSFIIRPDSNYSTAILSFDLITQGMAWVDLVQVNPDPQIGYNINNGMATVTLASSTPGMEIKYSLDKKTSTVYSQPFQVNKASTVYAELIAGDRSIAQASVFIPINKALGKKSVIQNKYAPQYAASGDLSLTDGIMGSTAFKDNKWLGFSGMDVIATIDMEQAVPIHSVTASFLADPNSGIFLPPSGMVYTSIDGINFKEAGSFNNNTGTPRLEPWLQSFTMKVKNAKARYIRVVAKAYGDIPEGYLFKGTKSWIFIDELMVE